MSKLIRTYELDAKNVHHDKLKKRPSGAKIVPISYNGNNMVVQIDRARVPFGLSVYENDKESNTHKKYSFELTIGGDDRLEKFRESLENMDDANVKYCSANSKAWWGKAMSASVMKEAETYKSQLKPDLKGDNPPRLKVKLPFYEGKPMFKVYGEDKQEINFYKKNGDEVELDWSWAQSGMEIKILAECEGLWVVNKNIYCTWRAQQIRILSGGNSLNSYAMIDDDEDDENKEASAEDEYEEEEEEEEDSEESDDE